MEEKSKKWNKDNLQEFEAELKSLANEISTSYNQKLSFEDIKNKLKISKLDVENCELEFEDDDLKDE